MNDDRQFGQILKQYRKAKDLTQEQLGDRVALSPETIRKLENGTRRASKVTAEVLARGLGLPEDQVDAFVNLARGTGTGDEFIHPGLLLMDQESPTGQTTPKTNLVPARTPFVGRVHEIEQLRHLILEEGKRLITLIGPPGIGKTRLSVEVARGLLDHFPDGVFWVPLSPVTDPGMVLAAIAQVLKVKEGGNQSRLEMLKAFLAEKEMLLVLDNFEHVIDAAPMVVELLGGCSMLKVIVSSRQSLHVYQEQEFPVEPLELPTEGDGGVEV